MESTTPPRPRRWFDDPALARAASRARWERDRRILRLDQLSPAQRRVVLALINAAAEPGTPDAA
jgi:hypothetical protein